MTSPACSAASPPTDPVRLPEPGLAGDPSTELLNEALRIVTGARRGSYGDPEDNLATIGEFWTTFLTRKLKVPVTVDSTSVAMMMVLLKVAREGAAHTHDNLVDGVGYLACAARCVAKQALPVPVTPAAPVSPAVPPAEPTWWNLPGKKLESTEVSRPATEHQAAFWGAVRGRDLVSVTIQDATYWFPYRAVQCRPGCFTIQPVGVALPAGCKASLASTAWAPQVVRTDDQFGIEITNPTTSGPSLQVRYTNGEVFQASPTTGAP